MRPTTLSGLGYHAAIAFTVLPAFCFCGLAGTARAQHSIRFEAEEVTGPADAWQADRYSDDKWNLWVDDRYASGTNPGSAYYDYLEFTPLPDPNRKPKVQGFAETRVEEPLGRGLVAIPIDGGRIYGTGSPAPRPTKSKRIWATARSCGVTTWVGRSNGESGIRPWSCTTWMAMAGQESA